LITALLSTAFIWLILYGRLALPFLIPLCAGTGVALAVLNRHRHTRLIMIDVFAQSSSLNDINPALKLLAVFLLIIICIASRSPFVGLFLCLLSPAFVVGVGKMRLREYIQLLALPLSFLLLSGFALLFQTAPIDTGIFSFRIFGIWFYVSEATQIRTALVIMRALGALSCLYMLSLTTPMTEIIGVLRRIRCPEVLSDLMYLIYRYIFILLSMHYIMKDAAKSRLGYINYRTSLKTTAMLYSELMSRSFRQASTNFDAMESRCYDGGIRFLDRKEKVTVSQAACVLVIIAATVCMSFLLR